METLKNKNIPNKQKLIPKPQSENENNLNNKSINQENQHNKSIMSINVQLILKQIFDFYCQYGERLNSLYLKSQKFFKFASEANLYDNNLTKIKLELIYKSEVGNNGLMDNKTFLNSLIKLADMKYNSSNKSNYELDKTLKNKIINNNNNNFTNRSNSLNQSYTQSQIIENKKNKSNALGRLINEQLLPLHSSIYNPGNNQGNNPFDINPNSLQNDELNILSNSTRNNTSSLVNILRLDHRAISESKFIENLLVFIIPNLYDIYKIYFPHEVSISEDEKFIKDSSYKNYLIFLKEFDLCPGLISKTVGFQIFQNEVINPEADAEISENQEYYINLMKKIDINELTKYDPKNANIFGQFLNFFKFIRILVKISQVAYDNTSFINNRSSSSSNNINNFNDFDPNVNNKSMKKDISAVNIFSNNINLSLEDKIILTLERIELSDGFLNLEKKTMKTHSKRNATLIPQHMLNHLKAIYSDKLACLDKSTINKDESNKRNSLNIRFINNYRELCEFRSLIVENWGEDLYSIFKGYCSFGDYQNTKFMTSKIFFKFLNDCKLLDINVNNLGIPIDTSRILNASRSMDNRSNNFNTPKADNVNNNVKKIKLQNLNKEEYENFNNIEGESNQNMSTLRANKIKLLKPNEVDSIFIKLCNNNSENQEGLTRDSSSNNMTTRQNRDGNITGMVGAGNGSTNDLLNNNNNTNISFYPTDRANSSNRISIKRNKNSKLDYSSFINSIEIISRFAFEKLEVNGAIERIVLDYILKNVSGKYTEKFNDNKIKIEYLKKKQDDPELLKILELIYDTFTFVFQFYCDKKGLMNFSQLMK